MGAFDFYYGAIAENAVDRRSEPSMFVVGQETERCDSGRCVSGGREGKVMFQETEGYGFHSVKPIPYIGNRMLMNIWFEA